MNSMSVEDKYREVWRLLRIASRGLIRVRDKELAPYHISVRHAAMLQGIEVLGEDATVVGIARRQHRDPSSVSNIIIRMEKMGLVKRLIAPNNRRQIHVVMTRKGEELHQISNKQEAIKRVLSDLSEEQCDQLINTMEGLRSSIRREMDGR